MSRESSDGGTTRPETPARPRRVFAHSANARGDWHELCDHLESVARLARTFAEPFGAGSWAHLAGLWHDLGKFSQPFQDYLKAASSDDHHAAELRGTVDHTSAGAQHAVATIDILGHLLAYPIAGHHAGLLDGISDGACLDRRLCKAIDSWEHGLAALPQINPQLELPPFLDEALAARATDPRRTANTFAFFTRMLFSCLVDADFLDTEMFMNPDCAAGRPAWPLDVMRRMEDALDRYVARLSATGPVDAERRKVREACLAAASNSPGLFSLTVPTGGGKTLSSLAFALRHAALNHLCRVVYVVPFTSIIEQNAGVFRRVFDPLRRSGTPDPVVEHHSALDPDQTSSSARLAAENWDAPLIVTTSVQFYESLFASRSSRCRKLHNLAEAVIILDEVQKLPVDLLEPCILALRELASNYRSTIILCTATQPALHSQSEFPIGLDGIREIVPDPESLYLALKRVDIVDLGQVTDDELAGRIDHESQVLCIVNTRRHARELFQRLDSSEGVLHLSAAMCPQHRSEVLDDIKLRLDRGAPCRVISTQLVEAGVDVDFPTVYRSLAGLDSIAQAAGRCNRNGRLDRGTTHLFRSEHQSSERFLRDTTNATAQLLGDEAAEPLFDDLLSLAAVDRYFRLYYWSQQERWDARDVLGSFKLQNNREFPFLFGFHTAASKVRLIEDGGESVIVPWGERGRELCDTLRCPWTTPDMQLLRSLQRYVVQIPRRQWQRSLGRALDFVHDGFAALLISEIYYDRRLGLVIDREDLEPATCII